MPDETLGPSPEEMGLKSEEMKSEENRKQEQQEKKTESEGNDEELKTPEENQNEQKDNEKETTKETKEQIELKESHDDFREKWYYKYSKQVPPGLAASIIGLTSFSALMFAGPEGPIGKNTGIENLAMMFGPALVTEIAGLIPRGMVKIQEIKEWMTERKEDYKSKCEANIEVYQEYVDSYELEIKKNEIAYKKFLEENPDAKLEKYKEVYYYEKSINDWKKSIQKYRKGLNHWQVIYSKKFGNKEA